MDNRSSYNVAKCEYLGMIVTYQDWIQEEIKISYNSAMFATIRSRNASFRFLSQKVKIIILKPTILLWFCVGVNLYL
jgi:hypothetical protein